MKPWDEYRLSAAEFAEKAKQEDDEVLKAQFERLVQSWLRLAEQAEQNSEVLYEAPKTKH